MSVYIKNNCDNSGGLRIVIRNKGKQSSSISTLTPMTVPTAVPAFPPDVSEPSAIPAFPPDVSEPSAGLVELDVVDDELLETIGNG
jgi:hypothetical protein